MKHEPMRDAVTPSEMRAEIYRAQYDHYMIKSVMDAANYSGMSAEDRYTVLSCHALRQMLRLENVFIESEMINPMPPMVMK